MANENFKDIETLRVPFSAVLPGLINRQVFTFNDEAKKKQKAKVEKKANVVLLPTKHGIEEFRERDTRIASFCEFHSYKELEDGKTEIMFRCLSRCLVTDLKLNELNFFADVEILPVQMFEKGNQEQDRLMSVIQEQFKEYLMHDINVKVAQIESIKNPKSIDHLIEIMATAVNMDIVARRKLLEELDSVKRLQILSSALETRIFERSTEKGKDLVTYYKDKISDLVLDSEIKKIIYIQVNRLRSLQPSNADYGKAIDWLDRVIAYPWNQETQDNRDLELAKKILKESHFGMERLKQRILDIIAVRKYAKKQPPQILCLYGPPGVGKSTIAKSIAEALNKKYAAVALGGVRGSAEIQGMKQFFNGAKPGAIIEGITNAASNNCLILLDEIDKMGENTLNGDPSAVLLQVMDRNQNKAFKDLYFDIPVDLSNIFFIATANDLRTISEPLLNRMEILTLDGYSLNEKVHIVNNHLIKKVMKEFGLEQDIISMSDETIAQMIEQYTFESGVRQLENVVRELCRKHIANLAIAGKPLEHAELKIHDINNLVEGYYERESNMAEEDEIGVVNKMTVTNGNIGAIKRLEVVIAKGKGDKVISDNIIGTAKSTFKTVSGLLRFHAQNWGIPDEVFTDFDIHIHSPIHEQRNDGSSGGVADVICILSAVKNIPVPHTIAFTGAITLKGRVMAIGGVKEKVLAAQRSNQIKTVVIPQSNKKDVDKLPPDVYEGLEFKYFTDIQEVYQFIFGDK
ncbi:MAG: AAA family ATPase [Firmicutes bacterium]|nr:AAA family ATPase [Bacillota bacterium]